MVCRIRGEQKMRYNVRDVIDVLEYNELTKLKKDLKHGGIHLRKLVEERIEEEQKKHNKKCCICGERIDTYSMNNFTLLFGPEDIKKKASFCALDCLNYFLKELEIIRKKEIIKEVSYNEKENR